MITEIPYLKKIFIGSNFWGGTETSFDVIRRQLTLEGNKILINDKSNAFDVLHVYTYFLLAFYLMRRFKGKKPIVIHSNTTPADVRKSVPFDKAVLSLAKPYLKQCYNLADLVICVSSFAKDSLKKLGVKTRMEVLPHGVNLSVMKYSREKRKHFREKFCLTDDDYVVLSVGHLIQRKGISTFFNLAKKLPDIKFFWVGPFLISLDHKIAWMIKNKPQNLVFTGYLDDVVSAYSACDVFVFPSYSENFGIPIIEAAACKKPVIVRDIPSYSWLKHNVECLKAKKDKDFFVYTKMLLENKELRRNLIKEGFKNAKNHDIKNIVKRLTDYYNQIIQNHN